MLTGRGNEGDSSDSDHFFSSSFNGLDMVSWVFSLCKKCICNYFNFLCVKPHTKIYLFYI